MSRTRQTFDRIGAAAIVAGLLALLVLFVAATIGAVRSAPSAPTRPGVTVTVADGQGDDNGDGRVEEDESGWDCRTMGNRVCGPAAGYPGDVAAVRARS
ncbi:hypothetical protein ACFUC2_05020 [[Kitasatospora] papulosa]|uniref:hypothetical protein n=1 Tax=[Kitasatospora] papulosa TaxID=1464011 RepID=UPI00363E8EB6